MENQKTEVKNLRFSEIIEILRDPQIRKTDPDRLAKAIERAGALKVTAAIDDLIGLLTFRHILWWEKRKPNTPIIGRLARPGENYPATDALYYIGKPSLPALVKVLETHEEASMESKHALYTVRLIFRYDPEGSGRAYLEEAAQQASSTPGAQNLIKASQKVATAQKTPLGAP